MSKRIMSYRMLMEKGAKVLSPPQFYIANDSQFGKLWKGSATVELNGVVLQLVMWRHYSGLMSIELAQDVLFVDTVQVQNHWYEAYWHTLTVDGRLYFHSGGWFGLHPARLKLHELVNQARINWRLAAQLVLSSGWSILV